jgi:pyruvate/2-oxoacid:ferredoxin oxidoreductase beta subunit
MYPDIQASMSMRLTVRTKKHPDGSDTKPIRMFFIILSASLFYFAAAISAFKASVSLGTILFKSPTIP